MYYSAVNSGGVCSASNVSNTSDVQSNRVGRNTGGMRKLGWKQSCYLEMRVETRSVPLIVTNV